MCIHTIIQESIGKMMGASKANPTPRESIYLFLVRMHQTPDAHAQACTHLQEVQALIFDHIPETLQSWTANPRDQPCSLDCPRYSNLVPPLLLPFKRTGQAFGVLQILLFPKISPKPNQPISQVAKNQACQNRCNLAIFHCQEVNTNTA